MRIRWIRWIRWIIAAALLSSLVMPVAARDEVVVYSERKEHLIRPVFEAWTAETGIPVRYITDNAGALIERLAAEGNRTPADLLLTVDAGNLWHAGERGVLAPVESVTLNENIPVHLRDPDGRWFGLSLRARTIVYSTERVAPNELSSYEALAETRWQGRLCLRTSKKVYNQSLVAGMIAHDGVPATEQVVSGWVNNLAAGVFSSDTLLLKAIAAGQCDVGIVNTYYLARLLRDDPDFAVGLFWADQSGNGTHVNVSGAGLTANAPHRDHALALLEWLSGDEAQKLMAELNLEFPAKASVPVDPLVKAWGPFKSDPLNVAEYGRLQAEAVMLMDRVGYH